MKTSNERRIYTEPRTASNPYEYVESMQKCYDELGIDIRFRVVSIDGMTKAGRIRYTLEVDEAAKEG